MSDQRITYAANVDPAAVAKIEAARAKLKPCCMRCRRTLTKREIPARVCADRRECTVRQITRPSKVWYSHYTRARTQPVVGASLR